MTGEPAVEPTAYEASDPGEPLVGRDVVEAAVEDGSVTLIDTRSAAEYDAAHTPGAVQLGWEALVGDGSLKPESEIRAILDDRDIDPDGDLTIGYEDHRENYAGTDREPRPHNPVRAYQYERWC